MIIHKIICWLFGHTTYNQSRRYGLDGKRNRNPYYIKICYRCGKQERIPLK